MVQLVENRQMVTTSDAPEGNVREFRRMKPINKQTTTNIKAVNAKNLLAFLKTNQLENYN